MYTFEKSIIIKRPQQEVFEFVTNPANSTQWQRTTVSSEWTSDGSPGVGSKIKSVIKLFGRPIEAKLKLRTGNHTTRTVTKVPVAVSRLLVKCGLSQKGTARK